MIFLSPADFAHLWRWKTVFPTWRLCGVIGISDACVSTAPIAFKIFPPINFLLVGAGGVSRETPPTATYIYYSTSSWLLTDLSVFFYGFGNIFCGKNRCFFCCENRYCLLYLFCLCDNTDFCQGFCCKRLVLGLLFGHFICGGCFDINCSVEECLVAKITHRRIIICTSFGG